MKKSSSQRKKKQLNLPHVCILILHGQSLELVNYLISLFGSMDISANNVLNLPSGKMNQERKVEYYLKNCGLPLVLVTYDENAPTSKQARPNVYDEIARCRVLRSSDALILQERRNSVPVELPSNVIGQIAVIQFDKERFCLVIPRLLNEIRSRGFISTIRSSGITLEAGSILNDFMDRMDKLWDEQFDRAWEKIHRRDYAAERNFAETLDMFFQQYHSVINSLVRKHKRGDELKVVCDNSYEKAVACAARAWEYVADAKIRMADDSIDTRGRTKAGHKSQELYEEASNQLRIAKRSTNPTEKMGYFASVVDLVDKCLKQLRK